MQNRFETLEEHLSGSHVPLVIADMQHEEHRVLVRRDLKVKDLREQVVNRFVEGANNKGDYELVVNDKPLPLSQSVDGLPPLSRLVLRRVQRQHEIAHDLVLVFDRTTQIVVDKLPAIIGRSKRGEAVDVNLQDFPDSTTVSRRHAALLEQGGTYYIQNISEADRPLLVNDSPVNSGMMKELIDGAAVRLGKIEFTLRIRQKS